MEKGEQSYCLFCSRVIFNPETDKINFDQVKCKINQVNQFLELFSRYCSINFGNFQSNRYNACDNCIVVLKDFNQLYNQMDGLRLKLNWRIETLKNIVRQADKVPSRQSAFGSLEMETNGKDDRDEVRKLRTLFVNHCTDYLKHCWPKIILERDHPVNKNLEECLSDQVVELAVIEANNEIRSEVDDFELLQFNSDSVDLVDQKITCPNQSDTMSVDDHNFTNKDNFLYEESDETEKSTVMTTELIIKGEIAANEITTNENEIDDDFTNSTEQSDNSITIGIPDINTNKSISPCAQTDDDDLMHNFAENSLNFNGTGEVNTETNLIEVENGNYSANVGSPTDMKIYISEEMHPICTLGNHDDDDVNEHLNYELTKNPTVTTTDSSTNFLSEELVENKTLPVKQKRSLRKIFQCKICKLTFSTSERLEFHLKSHDDENDSDDKLDNNFVGSGSSSEGEADEDAHKVTKNYVQCSQCTKFYRKGNDYKEHMENVHGKESTNKFTINSNENESSNLNRSSKPTVLDPKASLIENEISSVEGEGKRLRSKFQCYKCKFTFSTPIRRKDHVDSSSCHFIKDEAERLNFFDDSEESNDSMSLCEDNESSYIENSSSSSESDNNCESDSSAKSKQIKKKIKTELSEDGIAFNTPELHTTKERKVPGNKFKCNFCKLTFKSRSRLTNHKIKHGAEKSEADLSKNNKKELQCQHCSKTFNRDIHKYIHTWKYHTKHKSAPRMRSVIIKDGFTINDLMYKRKAKFACEKHDCQQKFLTQETLDDHTKLHDKFDCKFCSETFEFAPKLARHEINNHMEYTKESEKIKRFKCPRCPYKCQEEDIYVNHFLLTHFNLLMDLCRCLICKAPFYSNDKRLVRTIFNHHITHHDINFSKNSSETFKCEKCSAYFNTAMQLSKHKVGYHSTGIKRHACADCGKTFRLTYQLRLHRNQVHKDIVGELKYCCEVEACEKRFETEDDLYSHKLFRHKSGNDPILMCNDCGKMCAGKSALRKHRQVHDEKFQEKRETEKKTGFVCEHCGKRFFRKEVLQLHYKSHSGPDSWNFSCEICSKKCLTKGKLREHMRVHTQEKPYVCEVCGQKYAHRHNWRLHLQSKHGQS